MDRERSIIHLNVADFAVAVEQALDRKLRGRPLMIAAPGASRATIYDMSEEAYRAGIRKGMRLTHAQSLSRDVKILPLRLDRYARAMHTLVNQARPYSPQIEQADGNGHLYVDVTGTGKLWGSPPDIAWRIRKAIRADMTLDPIWAVASNKLIAKVATRLVKPVGEYIVDAGEEEAFLKSVPVRLLPAIQPATLARLQELHLWKAGDVAKLSLGQLTVAVGNQARMIYNKVRGVDTAPVLDADTAHNEQMYEHEFPEDTTDKVHVENVLYLLADRASTQLRQRGKGARRTILYLTYSDGVTVRRQATLPTGENNTNRLYVLTLQLLEQAWQRRIRIRHLRLVLSHFTDPPSQLELFPDTARKNMRAEKLMLAMDSIRNRFGHDAIGIGQTWGLQEGAGA